jgi:uncharacterized protein YigA (DUF484 family)
MNQKGRKTQGQQVLTNAGLTTAAVENERLQAQIKSLQNEVVGKQDTEKSLAVCRERLAESEQ